MGGLTTELWGRFCIIVGTAILVLIGRDRFYLFAQRPTGLMPAICRRFACHPHVRKVVTGFMEIEDDITLEERSTASLAIYADHSLAGYADGKMKHGDSHNPLLDQMRSIIVPYVEEAIQEAGKTPTTVVEIGTGNGDVIAYLAEKYSNHKFIGVDLSVKVATEKHRLPNASFVDGYALDLFHRGAVVGDIVFSTSTFTVFPPKELENYIDMLKCAGVKTVLLADPLTRRFTVRLQEAAFSRHMAKGMWGHHYAGYFRERGFRIRHFEIVAYTKHAIRAKIEFQLVRFDNPSAMTEESVHESKSRLPYVTT